MDNFEIIEQYLKNKLSEIEKKEFENRLMVDSDLNAELTQYKWAQRAIDSEIAKEMRQDMQTWSRTSNTPFLFSINFIRKTAAVAACLAVLVVSLHFFAVEKYSNHALGEQYASISSLETRGNNEIEGSLLQQAIGSIKNKPQLALQSLKNLYEQEKSIELKEIIEWNMIICHLKLDQEKEAEFLLNYISRNTRHSYYAKAQKLKKDLKSFWRFLD